MSHVGNGNEVISVTVASLDQLILMVHNHSQQCPLTPRLQPGLHRQEGKERLLDTETSTRLSETAELCLTYVCEGGHAFTWSPIHTQRDDDDGEKSEQGSSAPSGLRRTRERRTKGAKKDEACGTRSLRSARGKSGDDRSTAGFGQSLEMEQITSSASGGNEEHGKPHDKIIMSFLLCDSLSCDLSELLAEHLCDNNKQVTCSQEGSDASLLASAPEIRYRFA